MNSLLFLRNLSICHLKCAKIGKLFCCEYIMLIIFIAASVGDLFQNKAESLNLAGIH